MWWNGWNSIGYKDKCFDRNSFTQKRVLLFCCLFEHKEEHNTSFPLYIYVNWSNFRALYRWCLIFSSKNFQIKNTFSFEASIQLPTYFFDKGIKIISELNSSKIKWDEIDHPFSCWFSLLRLWFVCFNNTENYPQSIEFCSSCTMPHVIPNIIKYVCWFRTFYSLCVYGSREKNIAFIIQTI